jgi:hypothetical protein
MKITLTTAIAMLVALGSVAARSETAQQVTAEVVNVEPPLYYTPDPRPECDSNLDEWPIMDPPCKVIGPHRGKHTERDRCTNLRLKGAPPNPDRDPWCDATWVETRNTNHSVFALHVTVACTAFDRAGRRLGGGASEIPPPEHAYSDVLLPVEAERRRPAGEVSWGSMSNVRIAGVKYEDVARVTCVAVGKR